MTLHRIYYVFCFVLALSFSVGAVLSDEAKIHLVANSGKKRLTPVTTGGTYSCTVPATPAVIELFEDVGPAYRIDLKQFVKTGKKDRAVVVRRAGKIEPDRTGPSWNSSVSSARFPQAFLKEEQLKEDNRLLLSGALFFCDYMGFPEFMGAELTLSGKVGEFTVDHHKTLPPGSAELALTFQSQQHIDLDEYQVKPPGRFGGENSMSPVIGSMRIEYRESAVRFHIENTEVQVPVELRIRGWFGNLKAEN
ncbi:hypothetical protein [Ruegeria arenilitoris]|uniref:hypothetical protein n=1 Tax=Ruegeria arenilitoris TaxID=1173585 RepID=UPI00147F2C9F|nr:hypothetical protein [Ruegeria arenilitoris]